MTIVTAKRVTDLVALKAAPQPSMMSAASDLEIGFTKTFELIWNDKGSGGKYDGAYYRPVPPAGFYALGHYGRKGYTAPTTDVVLVVRDRSSDPNRPALKPPVKLTRVWKDSGSGANLDGSFWRPEPPPGYVAMGLVCHRSHSEPKTVDVRCVRSDLAVQGLPGDQIWIDKGTGAHADFGSWTIKAPAGAPPGEAWIGPGCFYGVASHKQPGRDSLLWALRVPIRETVPQPPAHVYPRLTSFARPSPFEAVEATYEVELPFVLVNDPNFTDAQRLVSSPTYKLRRTDRFVLLNHAYNQTSSTQQVTWRRTISSEKSSTESFTHTAGISVTTGASASFAGFGVNSSVTISYQFSYTRSTTISVGESSEWEVPLVVPPGKAVAAWFVQSSYSLFRKDGSQVGSTMERALPDSVVFDEYPD